MELQPSNVGMQLRWQERVLPTHPNCRVLWEVTEQVINLELCQFTDSRFNFYWNFLWGEKASLSPSIHFLGHGKRGISPPSSASKGSSLWLLSSSNWNGATKTLTVDHIRTSGSHKNIMGSAPWIPEAHWTCCKWEAFSQTRFHIWAGLTEMKVKLLKLVFSVDVMDRAQQKHRYPLSFYTNSIHK